MKSSKAGRRKFFIAIALCIIALLVVIGMVGGLAPAIVNYLLQPWDWAKRALFSAILNVFHLTAFSESVDWSTRNFDKFAYFLIQTVQCFSLLVEESGLKMSQDTRKWLKHARNIAYLIEIPVNGFYNHQHFSDGDARINNPIWRWINIIGFTALFTLIFEWVIAFLFKACRGIAGVFFDNKEHEPGASDRVYDTKAEPSVDRNPHRNPHEAGFGDRRSATHFQ
jgi:hypothetical protein